MSNFVARPDPVNIEKGTYRGIIVEPRVMFGLPTYTLIWRSDKVRNSKEEAIKDAEKVLKEGFVLWKHR